MTEQVRIIIAVGVVLVVLVALFMGRKLKVKWGSSSLETGADAGVHQSVRATGAGSSVKKVKQQSGSSGKQDVLAEGGGKIQDVQQRSERRKQ